MTLLDSERTAIILLVTCMFCNTPVRTESVLTYVIILNKHLSAVMEWNAVRQCTTCVTVILDVMHFMQDERLVPQYKTCLTVNRKPYAFPVQ